MAKRIGLMAVWIVFWMTILTVLRAPGMPLAELPYWTHILTSMMVGWYADTAATKWLPSMYNYVKISLNNWAKSGK